ncbi:MAG: (2Fe-2S)-binding protein [bacterium]|nr:(2Fe-2S)-binding protein [bacterium]
MNSTTKNSCPGCGVSGKRVKTITLRSLLHPGMVLEIGNKAYFFCGSPDCNTVYFTEDGSRTFSKTDLTVRVGVKESSQPKPVCYCFGHSIEEIFDEVERTGKSTVIADIRRRITSEGCSCETKNPQGACCLGTVEGVVRMACARFGVEESASKAKGENKGCCGPGNCCK